MIIVLVIFKVKLMFQVAMLHIIFNMATSNLNEKILYAINKTNALVATALNKACLMEQFYRICSGTAIFLSLFSL